MTPRAPPNTAIRATECRLLPDGLDAEAANSECRIWCVSLGARNPSITGTTAGRRRGRVGLDMEAANTECRFWCVSLGARNPNIA